MHDLRVLRRGKRNRNSTYFRHVHRTDDKNASSRNIRSSMGLIISSGILSAGLGLLLIMPPYFPDNPEIRASATASKSSIAFLYLAFK